MFGHESGFLLSSISKTFSPQSHRVTESKSHREIEFANTTNKIVIPSGARNLFLIISHSRVQSQSLRYQVLYPFGNDQRLRHASQRRERKFLSLPRDYARREIDVDLVARNDRLLFGRNFFCELLAQALHQLRNLHAQEAVVIRISQVSLRKAGSDH